MFDIIGVEDFAERYPRIVGVLQHVKTRPNWDASMILPTPGEPMTQVAA